jgi:UPF0755 protein
MSDDKFYPDEFDIDEFSVDELIEETKAELEDFSLVGSEQEAPPDEFAPDFGTAFDDYGEYEGDSYEEEEPPLLDKPKRKRIVPLFVKILVYVVVVGLIAVGIGFGAWEAAQDVLGFGRSDETVQVTIAEGDSLDDIARMLKDVGIIKYPKLFKIYCNFTKSADKMDPGTYELVYNYDYHAIVSGMIAGSPNRTTVRVMIPEGASCAQIFALMEEKGVCTAEELRNCVVETEFDYWFLEDVASGSENRLEGFLFPDTYDFYVGDSPERVLNKLLSNFEKKFSDEARAQLDALNADLAQTLSERGYDQAYIDAHSLDVYDLIIVASLIEKETAGASESGSIASVIYNRLTNPANYPYLNIDAAIVYALGGSVSGSLTYEDLQIDSPYNTYTNTGLPIGPISNPGLSSISAALNPTNSDYYYYALDSETGMHHFSETYDEHNRFLEGQNHAE